jgi:hypothetical protein
LKDSPQFKLEEGNAKEEYDKAILESADAKEAEKAEQDAVGEERKRLIEQMQHSLNKLTDAVLEFEREKRELEEINKIAELLETEGVVDSIVTGWIEGEEIGRD